MPRLIELLSAATACSEELKPKGIYLWGTVISAQVKAKQTDRDRREQGISPGKDGRGWRGRSADG